MRRSSSSIETTLSTAFKRRPGKRKGDHRRQCRFRETDDDADSTQHLKRHVDESRVHLLGVVDDEEVVQTPNRPYPPRMKEALESLCDAGEDERSEAQADRKHTELIDPPTPPEVKIAAPLPANGHVAEGVFDVYGRCPILR